VRGGEAAPVPTPFTNGGKYGVKECTSTALFHAKFQLAQCILSLLRGEKYSIYFKIIVNVS